MLLLRIYWLLFFLDITLPYIGGPFSPAYVYVSMPHGLFMYVPRAVRYIDLSLVPE